MVLRGLHPAVWPRLISHAAAPMPGQRQPGAPRGPGVHLTDAPTGGDQADGHPVAMAPVRRGERGRLAADPDTGAKHGLDVGRGDQGAEQPGFGPGRIVRGGIGAGPRPGLPRPGARACGPPPTAAARGGRLPQGRSVPHRAAASSGARSGPGSGCPARTARMPPGPRRKSRRARRRPGPGTSTSPCCCSRPRPNSPRSSGRSPARRSSPRRAGPASVPPPGRRPRPWPRCRPGGHR